MDIDVERQMDLAAVEELGAIAFPKGEIGLVPVNTITREEEEMPELLEWPREEKKKKSRSSENPTIMIQPQQKNTKCASWTSDKAPQKNKQTKKPFFRGPPLWYTPTVAYKGCFSEKAQDKMQGR